MENEECKVGLRFLAIGPPQKNAILGEKRLWRSFGAIEQTYSANPEPMAEAL